MRRREDIFEDAQILFAFLSDGEPPPDAADMVLAMGSHDLNVASTAARAFFETGANWLVCSGGFGKDTSSVFQEPEGALYAERCRKAGVPNDRILAECRAANSGENFQFSRALLEERRLFPRTGVIACKPYMAKRAWATGAKQWPEVRWSVFHQDIRLADYLDQGNDPTDVFNLMVGDLQRLRVYAGTFQVPVPVPELVWLAYERLASDGYTRFVIRNA